MLEETILIPKDEALEEKEKQEEKILRDMAIYHLIKSNDRFTQDIEDQDFLGAYHESHLTLEWFKQVRDNG